MHSFRGRSHEWNTLIANLPDPHLLQTWEWAMVKAKYGWRPMPFVWEAGGKIVAAAMILRRVVPIAGFAPRMCLLYAPKGPMLDWHDESLYRQVLDDLQRFALRQGAIFLKIDPDVLLGTGIPGSADDRLEADGQGIQAELRRRGWVFSSDQVQFRNTVLLDLSLPEEELLARMKQKTRYNIRLAGKKGVKVRQGNLADLPMLYRLYVETSRRDGFIIRQEDYYRFVWETFMHATPDRPSPEGNSSPYAFPLVAEVEGQPVAGLFLFCFAGRAYYLYGMSSSAHREKMSNYLLQWEAVRRAKAAGCRIYDLWGAPDEFNEQDRLWNVFRFKEGFGGSVVRTLGAWDYVPVSWRYWLYMRVVPAIRGAMRMRIQ